MSHIVLQHPISMEIKKVPTGFSWTFLFFGGWVALIRGDVLVTVLMLILAMWMLIVPPMIFAVALAQFVGAFLYNEMYLNRLKNKGWVACKYANPV